MQTYHGRSLFEQFDPDIQTQIELLLGQSRAILQEGCDILERRYGTKRLGQDPSLTGSSSPVPLQTTPASASHLTRANAPSFRRSSSTSVWTLLRWSLRDKERVESILVSFRLQNDKIYGNIKLWCLASDLGVDVNHLKRLQTDDNSRRLGFDTDATLKLTHVFDETPGNLELTGPDWRTAAMPAHCSRFTSTFSLVQAAGKTLLQETHVYTSSSYLAPGSASKMPQVKPAFPTLDDRTRSRVNSLACLLYQPKGVVFRIPQCLGWTFSPQYSAIHYFFQINLPTQMLRAGPAKQEITTLSDLLANTKAPELSCKYRIATSLARCISQLHMVQWLHESFRSENIIFLSFPDSSMHHDWSSMEPWVLGFEFSRQETDFSDGLPDYVPARDIYRHPQRQGRPEKRFNKMHDIYSLGVVLLEIGLWEPALSLEKNNFATASSGNAIRAQLVKHAERRLDSKVSKRYRDIVVKCLNGDFGVTTTDTKEDLNLQQAFRSQVVDALERMWDAFR